MSDTSDTNRRNFVQSSAATSAGLLIVSAKTAFSYQANSALSVGLLGCGRRGTHDAGIFAKNEFAKVSHICDIYDDQIAAAQKKFSGAKAFKRAEDMLAASDIDAVLIATPPILHPEHFEMAVKARKHIFMEKPAGIDPAGCRRVLKAAKSADPTKRITVDYQQRYGKEYKEAYQLVKSGELGAIKAIRASWIGGGLPERSGHAGSEEKVRNWLFYREMGGDIIVEQNCHNLDVINWFMGTHPVKASGYGGRAQRKHIGNIMDNLAVNYHFEDGTVFSYSANQISTHGYQDISETFMCENGVVTTSRKGYKVYRGGKTSEFETKYDITNDSVNEFVAGARTGKIENAAFTAVESTLTAIMGREAIYTGKETTWEKIEKA